MIISKPTSASPFLKARPVWPANRATLMNDFVLFRATFDGDDASPALLRVTGSTLYRIRHNGNFVSVGPARAPKGIFRVDELSIATAPGQNTIEIEVSGANVNSYYYPDQPSFLQAEVCINGRPVAWTGKNFEAFDLTSERVRKCPRFSYQRMFTEIYRLRQTRTNLSSLELEEQPAVQYLPRLVPQPEYAIDTSYHPAKHLHRRYDPTIPIGNTRFLDRVGEDGFKGFRKDEMELNCYEELHRYIRDDNGPIETTLHEGRINNTGFLRATVRCTKPGLFIAMFSELEEAAGGVDPLRLTCVNAIFWELTEPGIYELEAMEANTFKFVETFMANGQAEVLDVSVREFKSPLAYKFQFKCDDAELAAIFEAGRESFAANAVDCFTDCPSRERAGWLSDSFFIARTSALLTQDTLLERFFLENFAYAPPIAELPKGVIPMCYPADHPNGTFIPNWPLWLILQVEEYFNRSGDSELIADFREKLIAYSKYLDTFLNSDGLLEKLPSWVFVEWSQANSFVQDVNYPSNMLYAAALDSLAHLYHRPDFASRAQTMRETIRQQSWNGKWFRDHALRLPDDTLQVQPDDITETCQYYAFFFGTATRESHPALWNTLLNDFGPERMKHGIWPEIWPSNAFMGNYLRLELMSRAGLHKQVLAESKGYFKKMADATGTLWEYDTPTASCCHGFASYATVLLDRAK